MEPYLEQLEKQQNDFFKNHSKDMYNPFTTDELVEIAKLCADENNWQPDELTGYDVNISAGQVRSQRYSNKLIGFETNAHFRIRDRCNSDKFIQRSHLILRVAGIQKTNEEQTADHKDYLRPFDDRVDNLCWNDFKGQALNRRKVKRNLVMRAIQASESPTFDGNIQEWESQHEVMALYNIKRVTDIPSLISKGISWRGLYWRYKQAEDYEGEIWNPIESINGENLISGYSASSRGRLRNSSGHRKMHDIPTHGSLNESSGYMQFNMKFSDGRKKTVKAHLVICTAFHGPKPTSEHTPDHKDNNPSNNNADNLKWASKKEQAANKRRRLVS